MKLGMSQFPLLKDSSEIATVMLFCFVYSKCQQNSLKLSFFIFCSTTTKNITFLKIIHENTSFFRHVIFPYVEIEEDKRADICYTNL